MAEFKSGAAWYNERIQKPLNKLLSVNLPLEIAANTIQGDLVKRVFEDGLNSAGAKIGNYEPGRYRQLRRAKGREVSFVNLRFTGNLQLDLSNGGKTLSTALFKRISGVKRTRNADIIEGQEKRYGKIFTLTEDERDDYKQIVQLEFTRLFVP